MSPSEAWAGANLGVCRLLGYHATAWSHALRRAVVARSEVRSSQIDDGTGTAEMW
jgi:hypothetical protein